MPEMIKQGLRALLRRLPRPVAKFVVDRIIHPSLVIFAALLLGFFFPIFMLIVVVIAPFNPFSAEYILRGIMERFSE